MPYYTTQPWCFLTPPLLNLNYLSPLFVYMNIYIYIYIQNYATKSVCFLTPLTTAKLTLPQPFVRISNSAPRLLLMRVKPRILRKSTVRLAHIMRKKCSSYEYIKYIFMIYIYIYIYNIYLYNKYIYIYIYMCVFIIYISIYIYIYMNAYIYNMYIYKYNYPFFTHIYRNRKYKFSPYYTDEICSRM